MRSGCHRRSHAGNSARRGSLPPERTPDVVLPVQQLPVSPSRLCGLPYCVGGRCYQLTAPHAHLKAAFSTSTLPLYNNEGARSIDLQRPVCWNRKISLHSVSFPETYGHRNLDSRVLPAVVEDLLFTRAVVTSGAPVSSASKATVKPCASGL